MWLQQTSTGNGWSVLPGRKRSWKVWVLWRFNLSRVSGYGSHITV